MKKKLLFSFVIILVSMFYMNVNALSGPIPYIDTQELAMDTELTDTEPDLYIETGETVQLYFYFYVLHDMPTDPLEGKATICSAPNDNIQQWKVLEENIATIDDQGKIKGLREGTATVQVCTNPLTPGEEADCRGVFRISVIKNSRCDNSSGPNEYKINFNTNGGASVDSIIFNPGNLSGAANVKLPTPKKDGYTFDGWYTDSKFKTKVTDISEVYNKGKFEREYENYCPTFTISSTVQAKWHQDQVVAVPDTALNKKTLPIIGGLFLVMVGFIVLSYNIITRENQS